MDDPKKYQESCEFVKDVNDNTFQSSQDTRVCYGVSICEKKSIRTRKDGERRRNICY